MWNIFVFSEITDDRGPTYKPEGDYIFYCDFQDQSDCQFYVTGTNNWLKYSTLSGTYKQISNIYQNLLFIDITERNLKI